MVEKADATYVYTIEGNADNQVMRKKYLLKDSKIAGYGRPKYDAEPASTPTSTPNTGTSQT